MKHFLCLLLLIAASCSKPSQEAVQASVPKKAEPVEVRVAAAESRRLDRSILVTGSLLPDETVAIVSEVPGRISRITVDFGQSIRKGEVVAELDRTELQIQLDRTRAALSQALARLGLEPNQAEKIPESTPAIRQAIAQLEDARFKFENAKKLVASGDVSQERYTELEKAFKAREATVELVRDELRTQWANVSALKAEVRLAEKRLRDTVVYAPFDGAVSERLAAPGQYTKENTPILRLVKAHPLRLRLEVPESAAGVVRPGTNLEFKTDAIEGKHLNATVRELNPSLNEQSRTLIAEARLTSADPRLRPGMFVQVRLILAREVTTVVVPKEAVYTVAGLTKVFTVRDGKVIEHRIEPGESIENNFVTVPLESVQPGDQVVISNLPQLVNGQEVRAKS